jgi:hypothetical protein
MRDAACPLSTRGGGGRVVAAVRDLETEEVRNPVASQTNKSLYREPNRFIGDTTSNGSSRKTTSKPSTCAGAHRGVTGGRHGREPLFIPATKKTI